MGMASNKGRLLVLLSLVLVALGVVTLAWRRAAVRAAIVSHITASDSDPMKERLVSISSAHGGSPIDCGRTSISKPDSHLSECGQTAFQNHKPFFVQYYLYASVRAFTYGYGLGGDAQGNVSWIDYDSRGFPAVAPTRRTQLLDEGRTRVTPCIRPLTLQSTEEGLLVCVTPVNDAASAIAAADQKPIETTVCAVVENPAAFNNKIVRLRGHVSGNFEYSMLSGDGCSDSLWFADGSDGAPPGLTVTIPGGSTPGAEDADGKRILPIPVKLVRNPNFDRFERLMSARVKADVRSEKIKSGGYVVHQVTATFVGRIDGVSQEIHEFHVKRSDTDRVDYLGFGHMGLFDAQFVMQSVENDAVLEKQRTP